MNKEAENQDDRDNLDREKRLPPATPGAGIFNALMEEGFEDAAIDWMACLQRAELEDAKK